MGADLKRRQILNKNRQKMVKTTFMVLLSQALIVVAIIILGIVPILGSSIMKKLEFVGSLQYKYSEIRRSIDMATAQWETARLHFGQLNILLTLDLLMRHL